ncbi:glycosyltransferase family 2 protein [Salinivibrio kushneri]|uniref:glycosyltransferase family 2 protein n=1 Tax=Salinivibrio kushneri TaxID=1908198 RepID=UPI0009C9BE2A|nr:glycosyltransferase [Salinivibrio kushneri]OOE38227.1 hypothetical protein BZG04_00675 [Salinivibrio kushneri]OOE52843.1 hypothetical protein BZG11_03505 [Salinivibrio kushneri]OOE54672.1 hypothetical protein BZG10_03935 [Salinivibrio kushneri]OOE55211.1 hypothetical protein BZG12_04310 [Salinivibrio kushneri]OOE61401.1 hypothetical protein BZG18_08160 [Salinivibrio kushneri]
MYKPKVSIIIPVYNVEAFIAQCLESVINQTYENLEIICINDGSTDNSLHICRSFAKQDTKLHIIDKDNQGVSAARNTGLSLATGEFVFFIDADDWLVQDAISILVANSTEADIVVGGAIVYHQSTNRYTPYKKKRHKHVDLKKNFFQLELVVWNKLYRHSFIKEIAFKEGIIHEDEEFYWKVFALGPRVKIIDDNIIYYRVRNDSITNQASYDVEHQLNYIKIVDSIYTISSGKYYLYYPFKKSCYKYIQHLRRKGAPSDLYERHIKAKYGVEDSYTFKLKLKALKLSHWCASRVARSRY